MVQDREGRSRPVLKDGWMGIYDVVADVHGHVLKQAKFGCA
jgi:hypothetical protein